MKKKIKTNLKLDAYGSRVARTGTVSSSSDVWFGSFFSGLPSFGLSSFAMAFPLNLFPLPLILALASMFFPRNLPWILQFFRLFLLGYFSGYAVPTECRQIECLSVAKFVAKTRLGI